MKHPDIRKCSRLITFGSLSSLLLIVGLFVVSAVMASPTIKSTPSIPKGGGGPSSDVTPPAAVLPEVVRTSSAVLGQDTFQRANQTFWGTASDGLTWSGDANANANKVFSIADKTGLISKTDSTSYSAVLGPQASDAEVYATGSISSFTNSNFGDVLRWTDDNDWYKGGVVAQ